VNGRLADLTVDHAVKLRLAPLPARLLPDDRALSEAEVNAVLNQVHDDHAYLRRAEDSARPGTARRSAH
jgi:hypothetical protein